MKKILKEGDQIYADLKRLEAENLKLSQS